MEVTCRTKDDRLSLRNTFLHVRPLPRQLHCRLDGFSPGVHGKDHVVPKHLRDLFGKFTKDAIVERPGGKRQPLSLLHKRGYDSGVTMTLKVDEVGSFNGTSNRSSPD